MRIRKVLNNNVVVVLNEDNQEAVVMGKGLAYKAKAGDPLDPEKIDKTFVLKKKEDAFRFAEMLKEIPPEHFELAEELIKFAKLKMEKQLHNSIYFTLTDHINTMVERAKVHAYIKNTMLWDIKRLYREEFDVARELVVKFNEAMGSAYDDNEAASITMHIVNAESEADLQTTMNTTKVINEILNIVKYHFKIIYDEDSLSYYRFVIHLRFFAQRLFSGNTYEDSAEDDFWDYLQIKYKEAYRCALVIQKYIKDAYDYKLENEECIYLTIHIAKVVSDSKGAEIVE